MLCSPLLGFVRKDKKEGACTLHFSPLSPQRGFLAGRFELTAEMSPFGGDGVGGGGGAVEVAMNHP